MIPRLVVGLILLFSISGSVGAAPAHTSLPIHPPSGKLFRFRLPFEPATLDWTLGDVPILVIQNAMRGLYRVDQDGKILPDLVESEFISEDHRTWSFHLKP